MAHINVNYKMYLPAGHHRQPRNANIELALAPTAGGDTPFAPPFFPQLPYMLPDGKPPSPANSGMAKLLFWSDTDGTTGITRSPHPFDIPTAATSRTVTGWYFPVSGPAGSGDGSTTIIDDAFSAKRGTFIDDWFVDVTSDPNLTADANVIGFVPTARAQTLVAKRNVVSTTERFYQWVFNDSIMPVDDETLQVPEGKLGIAIAIYQEHDTSFPKFPSRDYAELVPILFGVIQDGGGFIGPGPTGPVPVGPWDPLIKQLRDSAAVVAGASKLNKKTGSQITLLAAQDAILAIRKALPALEKLATKAER